MGTLVSRQGNGLNGQLAIAVHPGEEAFWLTFPFLPSNLAVYTADCDASGDLILMDCGKVGSKKEPLFFALVCINPRYIVDLKALKANEAVYRHFARAKAFCVGAADPTAILAVILAELGSFTGRIANYAADNVFALSAMRRDYENLHLRFSALESYLQRSGAQLVRERLFIPPALSLDGSLLVEAAEGSSFQILPVGSKGLCAIDIFVTFIDCGLEEGSVQVSLLLGDGKEPVTTWTIKPEGAKPSAGDWRSLALACAIEGINKTAILKIELQGLEPSKVKFGVSKLNPNRDYCSGRVSKAANPLSIGRWPCNMGSAARPACAARSQYPAWVGARSGFGRGQARSGPRFKKMPADLRWMATRFRGGRIFYPTMTRSAFILQTWASASVCWIGSCRRPPSASARRRFWATRMPCRSNSRSRFLTRWMKAAPMESGANFACCENLWPGAAGAASSA